MNNQWILARSPKQGLPLEEDFSLVSNPIPEPGPDQMLTRTIYLSLDPYQWGRRRSGVEQPGDVCHGRTVSQVVESKIADYQRGDFVFNTNGWQQYGLTGADIPVFNYMFPRKIDPAVSPISTALGVHGMLGLTAYSGMMVQCQPRPDETAVVSAASGGVGQVAGQLARIAGCRVVGIAGKQQKCDFVIDELGFDACVSHLSDTYPADLMKACPKGIDIYFENVGGKVFEAVLPLLNRKSRISLCGMISQYANVPAGEPQQAWRNLGQPTFDQQESQVHGLFVGNFVEDYQAQFLEDMASWINNGQIHYKEDLWMGLEQAPRAFRAMLEGGNFGKMLVQIGEDPTLNDELAKRRSSNNVLAR